MKLHYCPTCARVYYLAKESIYLCGRNHATTMWRDGKRRRFTISERTESNRPPWPIPDLVEEVEFLQAEFVESWLNECKNPGDSNFSDHRMHFARGTLGGRHVTREEVIDKYEDYVLLPAAP